MSLPHPSATGSWCLPDAVPPGAPTHGPMIGWPAAGVLAGNQHAGEQSAAPACEWGGLVPEDRSAPHPAPSQPPAAVRISLILPCCVSVIRRVASFSPTRVAEAAAESVSGRAAAPLAIDRELTDSRPERMVRAMGPELVWRLQHVWPKGTSDLTEINLLDLDDNEARQIVEQVEDVKRAFERFVAEDVVPHISRQPTRLGLVETVRLFTSEFSMNTDYLLLLSGILEGTGGVITQIEERYTITATDELGRFAELETYDLTKSSK